MPLPIYHTFSVFLVANVYPNFQGPHFTSHTVHNYVSLPLSLPFLILSFHCLSFNFGFPPFRAVCSVSLVHSSLTVSFPFIPYSFLFPLSVSLFVSSFQCISHPYPTHPLFFPSSPSPSLTYTFRRVSSIPSLSFLRSFLTSSPICVLSTRVPSLLPDALSQSLISFLRS